MHGGVLAKVYVTHTFENVSSPHDLNVLYEWPSNKMFTFVFQQLKTKQIGKILFFSSHETSKYSWTWLSSSFWSNVPKDSEHVSQHRVLWEVPQLSSIEKLLCQLTFICIRISWGRLENIQCPRMSSKFPLRNNPGQTGNWSQTPSAK